MGIADAGTYNVTITVNTCTSQAGSTTVVVADPAVITSFTATPSSITPGQTSQLCATFTGALSGTINPGGLTITSGACVGVTPSATQLYTLTVQGPTPCPSVNAIAQVTVQSCTPPTVIAGNDGPVCLGGSASLTATTIAGATYAWTGPNGFLSNLQNPTITNAAIGDAGAYTVIATLDGCASTPSTTVLTVNAPPSITSFTANPGSIAAGGSSQLCATYSGLSATIAPGGLPIASGGCLTVNPATTTTYTLTVLGAAPCVATTAQATVNVNCVPPPQPTASSNSPVCAGGSLFLSTPTVAGASYGWTGPNGFTSTQQNPSIPNVTLAAAGTYDVTVTVGGCTSPAGSTVVVINDTPSVSISAPASICSGASGSASIANPGGAIQWFITGGTFTSGTSSPTVTYTAGSGTSVSLTVNAQNAAGCGTSASQTIPINQTPAPVISAPARLCAGQSGTATVVAPPGATISWSVSNGSIINGQGTSTLTFSSGASGNVQLSVNVTVGSCTGTGNASVPISPAPTAVVSGSATICAGDSTTISAALTGSGPWFVSWSDGVNQTVGSSPAQRTVSPGSTATYSVTSVTDASCTGTASGSATITVVSAPTVSISAPANACANAPGNTASAVGTPGSTYVWSITNGTITAGQNTATVTFTAGATGTVGLSVVGTLGTCTANASSSIPIFVPPTAAVTGSTTICPNGTANLSVNFTGSGPWTIVWSDGHVDSSVTLNPFIRPVSPVATTTYTIVSVSNASCSGTPSGSATVTVNAPPTITSFTATPSSSTPGAPVTLTLASTGGSSAVVNPGNITIPLNGSIVVNPNATTVYTATVNGSCPPAATASVTVSIGCPSITVSLAADGPTTFCEGGSVGLSAAPVGGTGPYTYVFRSGATTVQSGPSASYTATTTGSYSVTVTDANGCSSSASAAVGITVDTPAPAVITAPATICANATGSASVANTPGATFAWSITGGVINGSTTGSSISYTSGASGSVGLSVTVTSGTCVSSGNATVPISGTAATVTTFTANPMTISKSLNELSLLSWTTSGATSITITPDIGPVAANGSTYVRPSATTTYTITATNGCGSDTRTVTVTVIP